MSLRYFVTGTDTGVGKTLVAEALLQLLVEAQLQPFAFKPYESGVTRVASSDALRLWRAAGKWQRKETVNVHRFKAPLAPFHAARIEGRRLSFAHVLRAYEKLGRGPGVVEGAVYPADGRGLHLRDREQRPGGAGTYRSAATRPHDP